MEIKNGMPYTLYSVPLTNKAGELNRFLPILSDWNIVGLRLVNRGNFGMVEFILPTNIDEKQVIETLQTKGFWAYTHTYYGLALTNEPGYLLNSVVTPLAKIGVNITDTFVTTPVIDGVTWMFLTIDTVEKGLPVLQNIPVPSLPETVTA